MPQLDRVNRIVNIINFNKKIDSLEQSYMFLCP